MHIEDLHIEHATTFCFCVGPSPGMKEARSMLGGKVGPKPGAVKGENEPMSRILRALAPILLLAVLRPAYAGTPTPAPAAGLARATFAGGCFWCMQSPFDATPGVVATTVGYTGGTQADPTYHQVGGGGTGHAEAIEVVFDPKKVSYEKLLDVFWHNVDPFQPDGQFCDHGHQYRTAVFVHDAGQRQAAEASKAALTKRFARALSTEIDAAGPFWPAEEYHQKYAERNPVRYRVYRYGCGRDKRLEEIWGSEAPRH
jgi:peptide-methionine (S)-S-oxide reductase